MNNVYVKRKKTWTVYFAYAVRGIAKRLGHHLTHHGVCVPMAMSPSVYGNEELGILCGAMIRFCV